MYHEDHFDKLVENRGQTLVLVESVVLLDGKDRNGHLIISFSHGEHL